MSSEFSSRTKMWPLQAVLLLLLTQAAWTLSPDFDFNKGDPDTLIKPNSDSKTPSLFSSVSTSTKSSNKDSRTERTLQETLMNSKSREWTSGFQKGSNGVIQKINSESSDEKTDGRSFKNFKASESGDSFERDKKLTEVNGKPVVSSDSGKQSSFSNSGQQSNETRFSSESSSSDNQIEKIVLPEPPLPIVQCFERSRLSVIFLVHTSASADEFARTLGFLETFFSRWRIRVLLVFFNRRVLDFLDFPPSDTANLHRRLAEAAHSLRKDLNDACDLVVATAEAARLRQSLRLASPTSLVLLTTRNTRLDEIPRLELRRAAEDARRSFDQLTCVVERGPQSLSSQAADLLNYFFDLLPLEFGGARVDAHSADALGRRVCDSAGATPESFVEPGRRPDGDWAGGWNPKPPSDRPRWF